MFKFLKDKLKKAISKFSEEAEKVKKEEEKEIKISHNQKIPDHLEEQLPIKKAEVIYEQKFPDKKRMFEIVKEKVTTKKLSSNQFESLFEEMEITLLEGNVALEVIEKIKLDLKQKLVEKPITILKTGNAIKESLRNSIYQLMKSVNTDIVELVKSKKEKPYVIAFFGINGTGKTTTIAKFAMMLKTQKISSVIAASDTFRAASIEQIQKHADAIKIKIVRHNYGSDPAAVAFDAISYAKNKFLDVVLIDTAGRMHSNKNLMDELKKIVKVSKPDLKIFVGEAIAGNDSIEQANKFNEAVGIDAIVLTKADVDEKGGTAISISYVTKKPIIYLGTGQEYKDIERFNPDLIIERLGI